MYKFIGKPGNCYSIDNMKLNYKCSKEDSPDGSNKCNIARGKSTQDPSGITSYAGINEDEWTDWAHESGNINDALKGKLTVGSYDSQGRKLKEKDVEEFKKVASKLQDAASSHLVVSPNISGTLFRGESYENMQQALDKYKKGSKITSDRLLSTVTQKDIAMNYADTGDEKYPIKVIVNYQNKYGELPGIQTSPMGVPSNEVVMPIGVTYRVASINKISDNELQVNMYSTEKHPKTLKRVNGSRPEN